MEIKRKLIGSVCLLAVAVSASAAPDAAKKHVPRIYNQSPELLEASQNYSRKLVEARPELGEFLQKLGLEYFYQLDPTKVCKGNLRNFSNAAGWNMVFCGCAASPAIPSTWLLSAANEEGSARAVVHVAWPKARPCWLTKYCPNKPCASGY